MLGNYVIVTKLCGTGRKVWTNVTSDSAKVFAFKRILNYRFFCILFFTSSSWYDEIGVNIQQVKGKKETQPYSMNFIHYIQIT